MISNVICRGFLSLSACLLASAVFFQYSTDVLELPDHEEPAIGTALSATPLVRWNEIQPLNFGALVGGISERTITLYPNGDIQTNGKIINQSPPSRIGKINQRQFAGNPLYKIHPGRVKFDLKAVGKDKVIKLDFLPNSLSDATVRLSHLEFELGPDTSTNRIVQIRDQTQPNQLAFKTTKNGALSIDVFYGARLDIDSSKRGEINASMDISLVIQ